MKKIPVLKDSRRLVKIVKPKFRKTMKIITKINQKVNTKTPTAHSQLRDKITQMKKLNQLKTQHKLRIMQNKLQARKAQKFPIKRKLPDAPEPKLFYGVPATDKALSDIKDGTIQQKIKDAQAQNQSPIIVLLLPNY